MSGDTWNIDVTPDEEGGGESRQQNFIEQEIERDLAKPKLAGRSVFTRFPPEPNGYLHIGHAKSICFNFGLAKKYNGKCNLRFDDTNPTKESQEYVDSIMADVRWLGFEWDGLFFYASDYFEQLHQWAIPTDRSRESLRLRFNAGGDARVSGDAYRTGTQQPLSQPNGCRKSESLRANEKRGIPEGSRTLRAKIDMAHANLNLRDPVMYRILHAHHHRTGDDWCIYPMYDWAHGQSDSIEGITHSICTLEFENHRPLYDWFCKS